MAVKFEQRWPLLHAIIGSLSDHLPTPIVGIHTPSNFGKSGLSNLRLPQFKYNIVQQCGFQSNEIIQNNTKYDYESPFIGAVAIIQPCLPTNHFGLRRLSTFSIESPHCMRTWGPVHLHGKATKYAPCLGNRIFPITGHTKIRKSKVIFNYDHLIMITKL